MQCDACGYDNPDGNRFCGMCGAKLPPNDAAALASKQPSDADRRADAPSAIPPLPQHDHLPDLPGEWMLDGVGIQPETTPGGLPRQASTSAPAEGVSGTDDGSLHFAEARTGRSSRSAGSGAFTLLGLEDEAPSADYLLEDDQSHSGRKWLLVAVAVALAAIAVSLWLRNPAWRSAAVYAWRSVASGVGAGNAPTAALPVPATSVTPTTETPAGAPPPSAAATPESASAGASAGPANASSASASAGGASPAQKQNPSAAASGTPATEVHAPSAASTGLGPNASEPAKDRRSENPKGRQKAGQSSPSRASEPDRRSGQNPDDDALVVRAQGYLHGKGAARNCSMALTLLNQAAARGNARASSQLGALYATGNCARVDRVQAYNWFARAAEAEPNNAYLKRECDMLWREMTPQERRKILE